MVNLIEISTFLFFYTLKLMILFNTILEYIKIIIKYLKLSL